MEASFGGVTFKGGKIFGLLVALSTLIGGLYGAFVAYKDYTDFKEVVSAYVAPDLSGFDKRIDLTKAEMEAQNKILSKQVESIKGEVELILQEVQLIASVVQDQKTDLKTSIRDMQQDIRHITSIVDSVEDKQKSDTREIFEELKLIEDELDLQIKKALENPLNNMAVIK
tara:strand:- start:1857 stop:2366 length:510 start_codon:yes stop_codon:yes gene_type:complete